MHWRCFHGEQQLDVIALYQHALSFRTEEQRVQLMKQRKSIWTKLDKLLASLPIRTSIILAGDFNISLSPQGLVAGSGVQVGSTQLSVAEDRATLMRVLADHRLTALNTWGKPRTTYHHPQGHTQIDYIAIRQQVADAAAKTCKPVQVPIAGWRSAGHDPLYASILLNWMPWKTVKRRSQSVIPSVSPQQLIDDQDLSLAKFQASVKAHAAPSVEKPRKPALAQVDQQLNSMWQQCEEQRQQHQQAGKSRQEKKAAQDEWRNTPQAKEHHKAMRKLARQRKRDQLLATLQEAETAAANKDSRHLYQYVRLLAPRHSRRRSASGDLIAPHEECAVLAKYARKLFAGRVFALPPLQPLPIEWFTPEAWRVSLGKLASRKAVLDDCASIDGWKQFSAEASTFLHEVSKVTISHPDPSLPPDWSKVQIAWLPKPSKSTASPENLRTIGLMGADTKAFIQILKQHAGSYVQRALQAVPQYAYRQQASTLDALLRASGHCRSVRSELAKQVDDVTARVLQQPMRELVGGLMISLDLSKAFDCLSYDEMYCSMQEIHIPEPLIRAIMHLHCNTMLTISHKGQSEEVPMERGLRQGCGIAPLIYAAWTIRLCRKLDAKLGKNWSATHLSLFADDKHGFWS